MHYIHLISFVHWQHSDDSALPTAAHNHLHAAHMASRDWICPLLWGANAQNLEVMVMMRTMVMVMMMMMVAMLCLHQMPLYL